MAARYQTTPSILDGRGAGETCCDAAISGNATEGTHMADLKDDSGSKVTWFVGAAYGGTDDQLPRFLKEGIWESGWEDKHLDVVRSVGLPVAGQHAPHRSPMGIKIPLPDWIYPGPVHANMSASVTCHSITAARPFQLWRSKRTDDPLDAMKARWNHIQGYLFPWLREEVEPMTEALGRLVTTLDVIGLEAFVPEPPRGAGRPPDDRRALARAFVAKAVLGVPTTTALIERLDVDKSLRRILGWERRSQVPSEAFPAPSRSLRRAICPTRCTRR